MVGEIQAKVGGGWPGFREIILILLLIVILFFEP
jgi:hypothetical protein